MRVNAWGRYFEPPMDLDHPNTSSSLGPTEDLNPYQNLETYAQEHGQAHVLTQWSDYYLERYTRSDEKKMQQISARKTLLELESTTQYPRDALVTTWSIISRSAPITSIPAWM